MARSFSGNLHVEAAQELRRSAKDVRELRQALAVVLPLELGLTLDQTAKVIGRSREETCRLRREFIDQQEGRPTLEKVQPTRRASLRQQQAAALTDLLPQVTEGGVLSIARLKPLLEKRLGKSISLATVYNMLHRHGWRKPGSDVAP